MLPLSEVTVVPTPSETTRLPRVPHPSLDLLQARNEASTILLALAEAPLTLEDLNEYDQRLFEAYLHASPSAQVPLVEAMLRIEEYRGALHFSTESPPKAPRHEETKEQKNLPYPNLTLPTALSPSEP